jgi:uncharacterized membrane protein YozB (DUF420 family)
MVGFIESTVSLGIEMVVLSLLIGAFFLKTRQKFRQHGITMTIAVALHISSILIVMIPSFISYFGAIGAFNFADTLILTALVHASTGIIAAILGVWLVGSWHLQKNLQTCFKKKRIMITTLTLWLLTIFLGIILYLTLIKLI